MVNRGFVFKLTGDVKNEYMVNIPSVGQLIDIEVEKTRLSSGLYGSLVRVGTIGSTSALDYIDAAAYLRVLVPELMVDLKVDDITKLDAFDFNILMKDYREQFEPWVNDWRKSLMDVESLKEENKEDDQVEEDQYVGDQT